ncbi:MAG: chromosome segregation protein SMC [Candidatus Omnitrophica bacterium]|nr:chromosome segregation protein SMC [Candidatus Omnitrophota bacterium]
MHLKKLEIVGFKSFLNKTKLKFEPGVTAVVGPNGCGKSNIVDAIKWVLGEQSTKSMRSSSMQDVIFNGTEKQEPVNLAEVSLTLSNEDRSLPVDYDEVIISRRLFRSGESEYLLNKTPVRLTDIRNLLMGTGIGTSSYSIVEQGKMDMVLSSKPEDRRYIFEEASGITRYKAKKREAMLKLERTQENLTRINDIIREVERQINSIERKARKAERYKSRFDELKSLDIKINCKKFRDLSSDDSSLDTEHDQVQQVRESLAEELEQTSKSLETLKEEFNITADELQRSQGEVMQLSSDLDKNSHVIEVDRERIQEFQKYVERLDWEIEEATERKDSLNSRLEGLQVKFSEVSQRRKSKQDELASAEENVRELTEKLEHYRNELKLGREKTVDVVTEQTKIKNALIKINADIQNALSRQKRLQMERANVETERGRVSEELTRVEEQSEAALKELEDKRRQFDAFNEEYVSNQQKLSMLNEQRQEKQKRVNEIKPRRQFLEKLISEREGVKESVKEIMKHVEAGDARFQGVHGILSELIDVKEDYEESLEALFAEAAHAIVAEDRHAAERIWQYLSDNSMESVVVIILDELRSFSSGPRMDISQAQGVLKNLKEIIISGEEYGEALVALFNRSYVAVSSEAARSFIDNNRDFDGRIIGEKGELLQKGMRRSRNYSGKDLVPLFGRQEKVNQMIEEENEITRNIEQMDIKISGLEDWFKEASVKKEALESELRNKEVESANIASRKVAVKEKFNTLSEELLLLDSDIEEEQAVLKQLKEESDGHDHVLNELEAEASRLQQAIDSSQEALQECTRYKEETFYLISDIKIELSGLVRDEENLSENLQREEESCVRMVRDVEDKRKRINENGERIKALDEEIRRLEGENLEHKALVETKEREIEVKKERKEQLAQDIRSAEDNLREKEKELEVLRDKTRDQDILKKELEYKRNAVVERMMEAYKVDIRELDIEFDGNEDWEELSSRIAELKEHLEKMGEVSLGAVEEHKQLEERFQFLTKQREDLTNSREALLQAITKINRTTRKLFMESFESIRKEFNDYFRMLFNGGKAELILEDESNVLECGIDIVVRPPGKKLHNIMQLSGGEKAMTAIALIFAIFKVNPSPFCILDEIDAPLDESNIVRFCRVLQEFLKLSQFIIVTHNRMTIQLADVLYGITMEEKGVSKIVSVKFSEEQENSDAEEVAVAA